MSEIKKTAPKTTDKKSVSKTAEKKTAVKTAKKTAVKKTAVIKKEQNLFELNATFGTPEQNEVKKPKITPRKNPAKAKAESLGNSRTKSAKTDKEISNSRAKNAQNSTKSEVTFDTIKKASRAKNQASMQVAKSGASSTSKKLINSLKIIENISHTLGISDRERITFDIEEVSANELRVRIVNGTKNFQSPWFAIKNDEPYIFLPAEILDMVFRMLRTAQKESFELRLERSIWQHMPIDFGDVWRVAMDELSRGNFAKEPDLEKLVAKIKQEHPNLFVDMTSFITGE